MQAFIDDGYTRTVGFNEVPKLYPKLEFTYRPYAGSERQELQTRLLGGDKDTSDKFKNQMAERLRSWNLGREITAKNINQLSASLFELIANTLLGYQAPDYEIEATEDGDTQVAGRKEPERDGEDLKN